jgi:hypothetical protein
MKVARTVRGGTDGKGTSNCHLASRLLHRTDQAPDYRAELLQQRYGLQECPNATLIRTASSHAEADATDGNGS